MQRCVVPCTHFFVQDVDSKTYYSAKSRAIIVGKVLAFASTNAWSALQQLPLFSGSIAMSFTAVFVSFIGMLWLWKATDLFREWYAHRDGHKDAFETLWDTQTEEAENGAISLTCSFLLVQTLRYAVGGALPDQDGGETRLHTQLECLGLFCIGLLTVGSVVCVGRWRNALPSSQSGTVAHRVVTAAHITSSMCFAWSMLWVVKWEVVLMPWPVTEGVPGKMVTALLVSALVFVMITVLDKIADSDHTSHEVDQSIFQMIFSVSLMVGFSWGGAFRAAIANVCLIFPTWERIWMQLLLTFCMIIIVLPAWRLHILPKVAVWKAPIIDARETHALIKS